MADRDDDTVADGAAEFGPGRGSTLEVFDLGVLLQALAQSLKVGTLRVSSRFGEKYICFEQGRVQAILTKRARIRLGRILHNQRVVEKAQLREIFEEQKAGRVRLNIGDELLRRGVITAADLAAAVRYQMIEELLEVFYWKDYSYEYIAGHPEQSLPNLSDDFTKVGGSHSVHDLLISVAEIIDQMAKFNQVLPSVRDIYQLTVDPDDYLDRQGRTPHLIELLNLIDGARDIRDLLRDMRMHRFDVMELLCRLRVEGIIRPLNAIELLLLGENQKKVFSPEKLARVYERVQGLGVDGFDVSYRLAEVHETLGNREKACGHFTDHATKALAKGDRGAAEDGARRALALDPDSTSLRRTLAKILEGQGRTEALVEVLRSLAAILRERGEYAEEEEVLARAIELRPGDEALLSARAAALGALGRSREAGAVYGHLARVRREAGDAEGALAAFGASACADPFALGRRREWVDLLVREGVLGRAAREAEALVGLIGDRCARSGHDPVPAFRALYAWMLEKGLGDCFAISRLAKALVVSGEPGDGIRVLRQAARLHGEAGRVHAAREFLAEAVDLDPDFLDVRDEYSLALIKEGDLDGALEQLARIARKKRSLGDFAGATRTYERMLGLDSVAPSTWKGLAELHAERGANAEAAECLARVGKLYQVAGRTAEAVGYLDRACRLDPEYAGYLRDLAEALAETLDMDRSARSYRKLMGLFRGRGEHVSAIAAGLRVIERGALDGPLADDLLESYRLLGVELEHRLREEPSRT